MEQSVTDHKLPELSPLGQDVFSNALMDPAHDRPDNLLGRDGSKAGKRFDVYRNNVIVSLMEALGDAYPALRYFLGSDAFDQIARLYVVHHPPKSPIMAEFGAHLASFIDKTIAIEGAEFSGDLARLERQWLTSFHEADVDGLTPDALTTLNENEISALVLLAQPAAKLMSIDARALSAWQGAVDASGREAVQVPVTGSADETFTHCLLTRPQFTVKLFALSSAAAAFVGGLIAGDTLSDAAQAAADIEPDFDIGAGLSFAITSGAFKALPIKNQTELH